jgi:hypothetical protein
MREAQEAVTNVWLRVCKKIVKYENGESEIGESEIVETEKRMSEIGETEKKMR